jgi:acyl carrier protein
MGHQSHDPRGAPGGSHTVSSLGDLQDIIREKYNIEPGALDPNLSMREQGLDSLAVAEFLFEVEDRLGLTLPEEHLQIETLAGLAELIDRLRPKQAA